MNAAAAAKSLQSCPTLCNSTRLHHPWDSPGKNTGVGCHFLLQCMKVKSESEVAQSCPTLSDPMDCMQPTRLLHPWDFPGKSTGVGCHCLLLAYTRCLIIEYYSITVNVRINKFQWTVNEYSSISLLCFFFSGAWLLRLNYYNILLLE